MDTNDDDSDVINDDGQAKKLGLGLLLKLQWEWRTIFQASMAPNYSAPYCIAPNYSAPYYIWHQSILDQTIVHHSILH